MRDSSILAILLLVACVGIGQSMPDGLYQGSVAFEPELMPNRFVAVDVLDISYQLWFWGEIRLVSVEYEYGRWQVGATAVNLTNAGSGDLDELVTRVGEVRLGWCLHRRPKSVFGSQVLYGMVPEVVIGVEGGFLPDPNGKIFCCAQIDYVGFGLGLEGGGAVLRDRFGRPNAHLYAGVELRLLAFNFGF